MRNYEDLVSPREVNEEGIDYLYWLKSDNGAFDGPLKDWVTSHKFKYFSHCENYRTVICAGGNQGMYPLLFSKIFRTVYAFEPDPLNFYCLSLNCQADHIIKMQAALGLENDLVGIYRSNMENTGTHKVAVDYKGNFPIISLDTMKFRDLDFIQLDVEGYENLVLQGGLNTIRTHKPIIALENARQNGIPDIMKSLGYVEVEHSKADTIFKFKG